MSEEQEQEQPGRTVPYARFQEVVARRNEAETRIADLEAQLQAASERGATADTLAATIADLKASHKGKVAELQEALGLSRAGLNDPEGVAVARALYGAQPEDSRPGSLLDYIAQFQAGGEDAPAPPPGLAPYLQGASKAAAAPAPEQADKPAGDLERLRAYGSPRRRNGSAPAAPDVNVAAIREARLRFSSNPSEENAAALKALLRGA